MSNVINLKETPTHKFATLRDQELDFEMNGFMFRTTVDKIDEVLPNDVQRYCVNHVLYMLDMHRQNHWDADAHEMHITQMHNTATIEGSRILISVRINETSLPSYMRKGARGISWDIHSNPNQDEKSVKTISYSSILKDISDCDA